MKQYYSAALKNDAMLQRDTNKTMQYTRVTKNDAYYSASLKTMQFSARSQKTMQYYSATLKNDAILQRDTKKRCNITARH
jgi:hypothetical protein